MKRFAPYIIALSLLSATAGYFMIPDATRPAIAASNVENTGPITYLSLSQTSSADLVAAVSGKRILVLQVWLMVTTLNGTVKFQSGGSTDITGAMAFVADGQFNTGFSPVGIFQTNSGEKLNIVLASTGQVSGYIVYQTIGP
jgi:hypothetical protein